MCINTFISIPFINAINSIKRIENRIIKSLHPKKHNVIFGSMGRLPFGMRKLFDNHPVTFVDAGRAFDVTIYRADERYIPPLVLKGSPWLANVKSKPSRRHKYHDWNYKRAAKREPFTSPKVELI